MNTVNFTKPSFRWLFSGAGFHQSEATMTPMMSDKLLNERMLKSYRELSPTFARLFAGYPDWTKSAMDNFADYYHRTFATNDCTLYMVPGRMPVLECEAEEREFAENVAERLEYLIRERDCRLIRYYCCTNELSVGNVNNKLSSDLEKFKRIQTELWRAFRRHKLENVGLIATDVSGIKNFTQVEWATKNMDEITAVYCAHNYTIGEHSFDSPGFYDYIYKPVSDAVQVAKRREKRFILGEFGIHSSYRHSETMHDDVPNGYGDGKAEAEYALMTCVEAIAAMNAGALALAYWTLADYPDPFLSDDGHSPESRVRHEVARFSGHGTAIRYNKNGLFRWSEEGDYSPRAYLFSYGLMSRFFRKNSRLLVPDASDKRLICTGVTNPDGSVSLCAVNLAAEGLCVKLSCEQKASKPYRAYCYECADPIANEFGDLQSYCDIISPSADGTFEYELPAHSLMIFTTDYIDRKPSAVTGLRVEADCISWDSVSDAEHCYYRVYEDGVQLGSTVDTVLRRPTRGSAIYTVKSVDRYGNV